MYGKKEIVKNGRKKYIDLGDEFLVGMRYLFFCVVLAILGARSVQYLPKAVILGGISWRSEKNSWCAKI